MNYMSDYELVKMEGEICNSIEDIIDWLTRWPEQIDWDEFREALEHIEDWEPVPEYYLLDGFRPGDRMVLAIHRDGTAALIQKDERTFVGQLERAEKERILESGQPGR